MRPALRVLPLLLLLGLPGVSALAADEEPLGAKPLDREFRGRVTAFDGKVVTLRYDFREQGQLDDWTAGVPFPIERQPGQTVKWFDERLELQGNTGVRHRASWQGSVRVRCRLVPDAEKDVGGFLVPEPESEDFATFTLVERFFHGWDKQAGGDHGIIKFGKQWRETGSTADFIGFRYIASKPPPVPLTPGRAVDVAFGLDGARLFLELGEFELHGKDIGKRLKVHRPGFYTVGGRVLIDDVEISGRLDPDWLKEHEVAWRLAAPPVPADVDAETEGLVARYAQGQAAAADLVKIVGDTGRTAGTRKAAAQALSQGPKRAVPAVIDLLYSPDETSRVLGIEVVKALLGKNYGFKPTGPEEQRSEAIRRLNQELKDHPELLEG